MVCMISKRNKGYNMYEETSKCQNLYSLFREINFLELPKYSWNLKMLTIIEKLKIEKYFRLENNWKIGTPFGTLVRQFEKLTRL